MRRRARIVPLVARPLVPVHLASQHAPTTVRTMVRAGRWVRVRSGAYVEQARLDAAAAGIAAENGGRPTRFDHGRALSLARISALVARSKETGRGDVVLVRQSAALVLGLDVWAPPTRTHVSRDAFPGAGRAVDLQVHTAPLGEDEIVGVSGARASCVVRTAVDLARFGRTREGVVALDRALRAGLSAAPLADEVGRRAGAPGSRRARELLDLADDGAESPWESWTRLRAWAFGLPRPVTQLEILTDSGVCYADLAWPELRLVVEFDGLVKYRDLAGGDPASAVIAEKVREDALRAAGWTVVRVTAEQLRAPDLFESRLRRALPSTVLRTLTPRPHLLVP